MNTIRINRKELVEKLSDEKINEHLGTGRRGGWEVHVFPCWFKNQEIHDVKTQFHQDGNFYGNEVGHVCTFGVEAFFDWDGGDMDCRDLFMTNDARSDAREEFKKEYELSDDDLSDLDDEMKAELEKKEREYKDNCIQFSEETVSGNMLDQIICEDAEGTVLHTYKVEWV